MTLHGEGEPRPTRTQVATQAATIELFTQWQTYRNGVHMDWDTFRSIDFRAIAVAVLTAMGWEFTADEVPDMPKLRQLLTQPSPFARAEREARMQEIADELDHKAPIPANVTLAGTTTRRDAPRGSAEPGDGVRPYGLPAEAIAEHGEQVQG